ncbi:selenium cofactor biosynthesis protein YqeC [Spirochaetota bacterium]
MAGAARRAKAFTLMNCMSLIAEAPRLPGRPLLVSLVGGGGKTSLMFALAEDAASAGLSVMVTTTTRIFDPRVESRRFDELLLEQGWGINAMHLQKIPGASACRRAETEGSQATGLIVVAAAGTEGGKLLPVDPARIDEARDWDLVLVEADGAKCLPLKAPAAHEPVISAGSGLVMALIGLDCLGQKLDERTAFRPELVAKAAGMVFGEVIQARHLAALAASPAGCFKSAPTKALRLVILNKLDLADRKTADEAANAILASGAADMVALAQLKHPDPAQRIVSIFR